MALAKLPSNVAVESAPAFSAASMPVMVPQVSILSAVGSKPVMVS